MNSSEKLERRSEHPVPQAWHYHCCSTGKTNFVYKDNPALSITDDVTDYVIIPDHAVLHDKALNSD